MELTIRSGKWLGVPNGGTKSVPISFDKKIRDYNAGQQGSA